MKLLWLSNVDVAVSTMSGSGTWVMAMAEALCSHSQDTCIVNISMSSADSVSEKYSGQIKQYKIKAKRLDSSTLLKINSIIQDFCPDLIHIWGTESEWINYIRYANNPVLVDMQGILASVYQNHYGGLSVTDLFKTFRLKEFLKPTSSVFISRYTMGHQLRNEMTILPCLEFVSSQSQWVSDYIRSVNSHCKIYETGIILRPEFYSARKWHRNNNFTIFSTATMITPLKGLYDLLKSFVIVKKYCPNAKLRLGGHIQTGLKKGGYAKLLFDYIKAHQIGDSIEFVGALNTLQLIEEYLNADVVVNPSYVESYSLVVAESMYLGVPTVASYVGGMAELGIDKDSILYYPKADYVICAQKILRIINQEILSNSLSESAQRISSIRQDPSAIVSNQLSIYRTVIEEFNK